MNHAHLVGAQKAGEAVSYVPKNVSVYSAAFAGALAATVAFERVQTSVSVGDYLTPSALAGAWAQAFDTAYGVNPADTIALSVIQSSSFGFWARREGGSTDPAAWTASVTPLVAMIIAAASYNAGQGVVTTLARVIAANGSGLVIANGAPGFIISGWTEALDTTASFDPVTGIFTAPNDGLYEIDTAITTLTVPQNINLTLSARVNDAPKIQGLFTNVQTGGPTNNTYVSLSGTVQLAKGDTLKMFLAQFSGGGLALFATGLDNFLVIAQKQAA